MLTIFALPRAFRGHNGVIQTNAIQSWTMLQLAYEIMLFGDDEGTAEVATKFGLWHLPDIERNEYGTPLVSHLFHTAQSLAGHEFICYVNADIILMSDFVKAVHQIQERPSLVIGRRWDLHLEDPLDYSNPDWELQLRARLASEGELHGMSGIDYFIFPRGIYQDIPPFAIGRTAWDNWLIYRARTLGLPVINATEVVTIVHQNHDFAHITAINANGGRVARKGIEGSRNRQLLGGDYRAFALMDATHLLTSDGLKLAMSKRHLFYRLLRLPEIRPNWIPLAQIVRGLRSLYRIFGRVKHSLWKRSLQPEA